jgi:ankyrin repeat protein
MKRIRKTPRASFAMPVPINRTVEEMIEDFERNRHPMDKAIERDDFEFVKNNLDITDDQVFYYAVRKGNTKIFEYAFPLFPLDAQRKALWIIGSEGRHDYLDFALQYITVDPNDPRPHELACRSGQFEMVKRLESLGIKKSHLSFFYALDSNNLEVIKHVYDGEDISTHFRNQSHAIPLDVLKFIMSHTELSQDIKRRIFLGSTCAGFIDVLEYLMLLPGAKDTEGALFETAYYGNQLPTLKYLLTEAPILSKVEEHDYQAFTWAYDKNYEDFVEYLVNNHNVRPESHPDVLSIMQKDDFAMYNRVLKSS